MRPMTARMNVSRIDEPIRTGQSVTLRSGGILVARYRVEDEESQIHCWTSFGVLKLSVWNAVIAAVETMSSNGNRLDIYQSKSFNAISLLGPRRHLVRNRRIGRDWRIHGQKCSLIIFVVGFPTRPFLLWSIFLVSSVEHLQAQNCEE